MASLSNDNGLRRILFFGSDGKRKALRLGRIPLKTARTIQAHVENLIAAQGGYAPPDATTAWLEGVDDKLRSRLAELGLAAPKIVPKRLTLGDLVAMYKERPKWRDKQPSTQQNYEMHFRHILAAMGAETPVDAVTETAADDLPGYLTEAKPAGAGLGEASAGRFIGTASMLFRFAVRSRLIGLNPFDDVKRGSMATTRKAFVDDATSRMVMAALPSLQWRLLFALARWGGLRTPSEPRLLRWGDIDWERGRMTVTSPKTARHRGHESRVIPIFPELLPLLEERYGEADDGDELVLPMMQGKDNSTFRAQVKRTLLKMGVDRWPRVFHSMRSTRQTELQELFPAHCVCYWLGNSMEIAQKHYLQVTDDHFEAAQKAAQSVSAKPRTATTDETVADGEALDSRNVAKSV